MILGSPLLGSLERRRSSGAEQLSCKQQVVGSNPTAGSRPYDLVLEVGGPGGGACPRMNLARRCAIERTQIP